MTRQAHRGGERVRIVDAHRVTQRRKEAAGEELHPLSLVKPTSAGQECLEAVGVLLHCSGAPALGKLEHRGGTERRPEPLVQEVFESAPGRGAIIFFELVVPQLRDVVQMVRCHRNTFLSHGAVVAEVRLAFVDEQHRIDGAIKAGEVPLFVLDERILVALPVGATAPSVV